MGTQSAAPRNEAIPKSGNPAMSYNHSTASARLPSAAPAFILPDSSRGIFASLREVLFSAPMRYEDRRFLSYAASAQEGEPAYIAGRILRIDEHPGKRFRKIWDVVCVDDADTEFVASFFAVTPYHKRLLTIGARFVFAGKFKPFRGRAAISQPALLGREDMGRIVPIYRKRGKFGTEKIAAAVKDVMRSATDDDLRTIFPLSLMALLGAMDLPPMEAAFRTIHSPKELDDVPAALDALRVLEIGEMLLESREGRKQACATKGNRSVISGRLADELESLFPFTLSPSQRQAWKRIQQGLESPVPANILLLGGVGSGKSAVAYLSALAQALGGIDGKRVALLVAPTTILADQLYDRLIPLAAKMAVPVVRGTGRNRMVWPESGIVISTHGILHEETPWDRIGLVVFDEEHRFGTEVKRLPPQVNRMLMSATPIPSTLAAIRFGDMQILRLQTNPRGREVETVALPRQRAQEAVEAVQETIRSGGKTIIVYGAIARDELPEMEGEVFIQSSKFAADTVVRVDRPESSKHALEAAFLVAEGGRERFYRIHDKGFVPKNLLEAKVGEGLFAFPVLIYDKTQPDRLFRMNRHDFFSQSGEGGIRTRQQIMGLCRSGLLESVQFMRESQIRRGLDLDKALPMWERQFPDKVAVLHGRMGQQEKSEVLAAFASGERPVLLATSIIEVGVDIEGVDTILVGNADRMGVASLVQLRGRVGRHGKKGRCFFISQDDGDGLERLEAIATEQDDEKLAEMDFLERGFGDAGGKRQSGHKSVIFKLPRDHEWLRRVVTGMRC